MYINRQTLEKIDGFPVLRTTHPMQMIIAMVRKYAGTALVVLALVFSGIGMPVSALASMSHKAADKTAQSANPPCHEQSSKTDTLKNAPNGACKDCPSTCCHGVAAIWLALPVVTVASVPHDDTAQTLASAIMAPPRSPPRPV